MPATWSGVSPGSPEFKRFFLAIPDDRFKGKRVLVDRSRVELVSTDRGNSIVFPVQIIGPNNKVEQELWARAGVAKGPHDIDADHVEEDILNQLKEGKGPESDKIDIDEIDISKVSNIVLDAVE
jgi:hypothetical protein